MQVSKTVVREALAELSAFGMVEIRQGRSTEVRALDSQPLVPFFEYATRMGDNGLRDLMELLRAIESDAAGLAATRHTAEEMTRLEAIMEALRLSHLDPLNWSGAHWDFHVLILEASRNELALFIFTALRRVIVAQKLFLHCADPHARRQGDLPPAGGDLRGDQGARCGRCLGGDAPAFRQCGAPGRADHGRARPPGGPERCISTCCAACFTCCRCC